ncbi:MAG: tRNA pseudouridine(55) synthase TruB [Candidatus Methylopumilus sp.]|nr:tRNA pseudouridine(55) synthase TruB [Candidatus Methylopumilus sp.]
MQIKRQKRDISGVVLLDKPLGLSSNQAMQRVKHLYQAEKAGHTGSLDPLATGLLPICLGEATKFANFLLDADKSYLATVKLGITTTSADAEGEIIAQKPVNVTLQQVESVLHQFIGDIEQTPPIYSALKVDGKPLYAYARAGQEVEIKSRYVSIHQIHLEHFEADELVFTVTCSKGTYIRTLAQDIGAKLGCGAHLKGLRRLTSGTFDLKDALPLEVLSELSLEELDAKLLPIDIKIQHLPKLTLNAEQTDIIQHGQAIKPNQEIIFNEFIRLYDMSGEFIGLAQKQADGKLHPKRLLRQKD